jgi:hypothetical protein
LKHMYPTIFQTKIPFNCLNCGITLHILFDLLIQCLVCEHRKPCGTHGSFIGTELIVHFVFLMQSVFRFDG